MRFLLPFMVCFVWATVATPFPVWCDSGIFRKDSAGYSDSIWRQRKQGVAAGFTQVHPYMPGAVLSDLVRLESAAAWQQLRDKAEALLSGSALSLRDQGWAYVYRGWGALGEGDLVAARDDAIVARRLLPRELQPVLLLCIAEARQGMGREAEAYLKEQTQRGTPDSEDHAALAAFYQDGGDWESARHWYGEALRLEPNAARLNANLAVVLWRLGEGGKAVAFMSKAVELSPGNADFLNERGMMLLSMGEANGALADFNAALKLDGRHCGALLNRGNLFFYSGYPSLAEGDFSLGLRIYPRDAGLLTSRARGYVAQGRYEEARRDLEAAFGVANKDARVLNDFAWFLATCPDSRYWNGPQAVELARTAIANDQAHDPGLYDTLAAALARSGDFKAAVVAQDEALLKGKTQGMPQDVVGEWENRLRLYLKGQTYEQLEP